jgi:hypothetical protein
MRKFLVIAAIATGALVLSPAAAQADGPSPANTSTLTYSAEPFDELCPRPLEFKPKPPPPFPLDALQIGRALGAGGGIG